MFKDIVELCPKLQSVALRFIHTFILSNAFYSFCEVIRLFDDFELGSRFRISNFVSVNLNQEKRNAIIGMLIEPFNRTRLLVTG